MDKEDKKSIQSNKEGEEMPAILEKPKSPFQKFLTDNASKIRQIAEKNTIKNKDGLVVVSKNDSWREEDWTEHYNKHKKK